MSQSVKANSKIMQENLPTTNTATISAEWDVKEVSCLSFGMKSALIEMSVFSRNDNENSRRPVPEPPKWRKR